MKPHIPMPTMPLELEVRKRKRSGIVRSIVKTITYRVISAASTMGIAWAVFGSFETAGMFGLLDLGANTILYFGHERLWALLDVRRRKEA